MMRRFAQINQRYSNLHVALKYDTDALKLFSSHGKWTDIAATNIELGNISGKMHQLSTATKFLNTALSFYELKNNLQGRVQTLIALAEANELNGHNKEAIAYDVKSEFLLRQMDLSPTWFSVILHLGKMQEKQGNQQKALEYYETGLGKSNTQEFGTWHVQLLRQAGVLWDKLGNPVTAGNFHQQSLLKAQEFMLPEEEARSQVSLAMSIKRNDVAQSIQHLKKALALAKEIGNHNLTAEIFHSLSGLYQQQSRYQEALTSLQAHHKLVDSLKNINTGRQLALMQGSYELAENKVHIQNLELVNRKRTEERNAGLLILSAILLLLCIVAFFLYRTKKLLLQLKVANTTKDKLFSIIGHDLRNPIGGITQLLKLMDQGQLKQEEYHQVIPKLRKQADAAFEILNTLLEWGQTQLQGIQLKNTIFDPSVYIAKNLDVLKHQAIDKDIHIQNTIPPGLLIAGDANHFDFIIRNLLSNAIKFSRVSGIIELSAVNATDNKVIFEVKDYGKGITEEQQNQFLKSNMNVSYGTNGEKGTGIGLLLSKEFLKAGGEEIWIKSKEGQGTSFYFSFKIKV